MGKFIPYLEADKKSKLKILYFFKGYHLCFTMSYTADDRDAVKSSRKKKLAMKLVFFFVKLHLQCLLLNCII